MRHPSTTHRTTPPLHPPTHPPPPTSDSEDDTSPPIPLQHQRAFGAGLKRKRIEFIPQSVPQPEIIGVSKSKTPLGDVYLSIVLGKDKAIPEGNSDTPDTTRQDPVLVAQSTDDHEITLASAIQAAEPPQQQQLCPICAFPLSSTLSQKSHNQLPHKPPHESTLPHQLSLPHSHPPSHLDRSRKGLSYLRSYGWDPDGRVGLGVSGVGRLYPVRAEERGSKRGVGTKAEEGKGGEANVGKREERGEKRRREVEGRKREERLRALVFGREEVNRYLGVEL